MSSSVQLAGNGFGGKIYGNFGTYQVAADGSFTVDTRDAPSLLARGMAYMSQANATYSTPIAPLAATAAAIIASGAISNGSLAILAQPGVMRPIQFIIGNGTVAITAGSVAVTYIGNDGVTTVDTLSLVLAASTGNTLYLSKGAISITSAVVSGLVGGAATFIYASTDARLSLPVGSGAADFVVTREYDAGATVAIGALSSNVLGTITPTNAPNGTRLYSFFYSYLGTVQ